MTFDLSDNLIRPIIIVFTKL